MSSAIVAGAIGYLLVYQRALPLYRWFGRWGQPVDDDTLKARLQALLDRHVGDSQAVEGIVYDGRVTVRGIVAEDEYDPLISAIYRLRGVRAVNNQLEV